MTLPSKTEMDIATRAVWEGYDWSTDNGPVNALLILVLRGVITLDYLIEEIQTQGGLGIPPYDDFYDAVDAFLGADAAHRARELLEGGVVE